MIHYSWPIIFVNFIYMFKYIDDPWYSNSIHVLFMKFGNCMYISFHRFFLLLPSAIKMPQMFIVQFTFMVLKKKYIYIYIYIFFLMSISLHFVQVVSSASSFRLI